MCSIHLTFYLTMLGAKLLITISEDTVTIRTTIRNDNNITITLFFQWEPRCAKCFPELF